MTNEVLFLDLLKYLIKSSYCCVDNFDLKMDFNKYLKNLRKFIIEVKV